jgi:hypothetical protein
VPRIVELTHTRGCAMKNLFAIVFIFLSAGVQAATVSISSSGDVDNPDPTKAVLVNQTFTMDLVGSAFNSGDLDGGGINFTFDENVVKVNSVTINTADWEFFSSEGTIDNAFGDVTGITFNSFLSRTGNLLFATVEFMALAAGSSAIGLSEYGLNPFATGGSPYPGLSFDQNGLISVSSLPIPGGIWLLGSALGLLGWMRHNLK